MYAAYTVVICSLTFLCDRCQAQHNAMVLDCEQNSVLSIDKSVYQEGETLTASCSLPSYCYHHVDDLLFKLASTILPVTNITQGNDIVTVFSQYVVHLVDNGKYLRCMLKKELPTSESLSSPKILIVAEPPRGVGDIKCVVFSYRSMNCSYLPEHQDSTIATNYTIYYKHQFVSPIFSEEGFTQCSSQKGNTCVFSQSIFRRLGYYIILVLAKNDLGEAKNFSVFNAEHIVKLDRIDNIAVLSKGTEWMKLSWQKPYPRYILENTTYTISVESKVNPRLPVMVNITSEGDHIAYNITNLIPYVQYKIKIVSFPWVYNSNYNRLDNGGYWSEPAMIQARTRPDVPGAAPHLTSGSFRYDRATKELVLFWQLIPWHLIHGIPEHYRIRLFKRVTGDILSCHGNASIVWLVDPNMSSTKQHLQEPNVYDACVDMKNHIGFNHSLHLLPIRIPPKELQLPKFYTRLSVDNKIEVRILENTNASRYTLYWCRSYVLSCLNKELHWKFVSSSEMTHTIDTDLPVKSMVVALSAEYISVTHEIISTGMEYAVHLFNKALSPIQMPFELMLVKSMPGTAVIQWKKPNKAQTVYIDHFTIDYCLQKDCSDPSKHHQLSSQIQGDLDGTDQVEKITGLEEEQTYEFRVRSDGDEKNSTYTKPIEVTIPDSGLSKGEIAAIATGCFITVMLLAAAVYSLFRKCCKAVVEYNAPVRVVLPEVTDEVEKQNGQQTKCESQFVDVCDDGYERIQDGQVEGMAGVKALERSPVGETGKPNHGMECEAVSLLKDGLNGHIAVFNSNKGESNVVV